MKIIKSLQPCDVDLTKLRYPCLVSPKYDGVKLLHFNENLSGRSFKSFRNKHLNATFGKPANSGFEGEVIAGTNPYADDLCRATTSAVNSLDGDPVYTWYIFDYVTDTTIDLPYVERISHLEKLNLPDNILIVPYHIVNNEEQLLYWENYYLELGAEGIITRDPNGKYKQGRATTKSQEILRLKRFCDAEGVIVELIEGQHNGNCSSVNELGGTSRSTHKENMIPNGMIGSMIIKSLSAGELDTIGAGKLTHEERKYYFDNPSDIIGRLAKYKHFPKGVLNKKRFPQFQCFRIPEDMDSAN